ncbi:hypothetical protein H6P81_014418 [Aristolochia fimbriata]|uniref:Sde2 N-terminal ubiquitin domain-containing protein n=1 Tax=Aristolochia fimbriata TaxID=158543 RepID=A0AAV7EHH8_ARIFI|nr:hypothetical protein H6P81_014418 [Aristolochia fimbriata]
MEINQIFVKFLDGRTRCVQIPSPTISGFSLKQNIFEITRIPVELLRLVSGTREISDETLVSAARFPSLNLLLRLRGGKGGFGSLLRGAATKAGQKKTNNFDACRDMSGRRLRHVNAEKKLEEWKAEVEERKLEKIAENFLKKKAKEGKNSKTGEAEKYVESYREVSAKCMEGVEASVKQSFELYLSSKRKVLPGLGQSSKRLKISNVKGKEVESDSSDDDDEDDEEQKSTVLDQGDDVLDRSPASSSLVHTDGESSCGSSSKSTLDIQNGSCNSSESDCKHEVIDADSGASVDSESIDAKPGSGSDGDPVSRTPEVDNIIRAEAGESNPECIESTDVSGNVVISSVSPEHILDLPTKMETGKASVESRNHSSATVAVVESNSVETKIAISQETSLPGETVASSNRPLDLNEFESVKELEILGMERLKVELQAKGLKCGGTLQERAGRLFMLKTTPIEKLPKKLLAKPLLSN